MLVQALPRFLMDFLIISYCDVHFILVLTSQIQKFSPKNIADVAEINNARRSKKDGREEISFLLFFIFHISLI